MLDDLLARATAACQAFRATSRGVTKVDPQRRRAGSKTSTPSGSRTGLLPRRPRLKIAPDKHGSERHKHGQYGCSHQHCTESHVGLLKTEAIIPNRESRTLTRIKSARGPRSHPFQAAAIASARAGSSRDTLPGKMPMTPSRSSLVKVRLTVSMVRPRKSAMSCRLIGSTTVFDGP